MKKPDICTYVIICSFTLFSLSASAGPVPDTGQAESYADTFGDYLSSTKPTSFPWYVSFYNGSSNTAYKHNSLYVRAERGEKSTNIFIDNGDGTVTDTSPSND